MCATNFNWGNLKDILNYYCQYNAAEYTLVEIFPIFLPSPKQTYLERVKGHTADRRIVSAVEKVVLLAFDDATSARGPIQIVDFNSVAILQSAGEDVRVRVHTHDAHLLANINAFHRRGRSLVPEAHLAARVAAYQIDVLLAGLEHVEGENFLRVLSECKTATISLLQSSVINSDASIEKAGRNGMLAIARETGDTKFGARWDVLNFRLRTSVPNFDYANIILVTCCIESALILVPQQYHTKALAVGLQLGH